MSVSIRYQSRLQFKADGCHRRQQWQSVSIRYQSRLQFKESWERAWGRSSPCFNPLSIASSIQSKEDVYGDNPGSRFNPLSIASSIQRTGSLVHWAILAQFQSAINRVFNSKLKELLQEETVAYVSIRYQSRLQFKEHVCWRSHQLYSRFNPLSIASSIQRILLPTGTPPFFYVSIRYQSRLQFKALQLNLQSSVRKAFQSAINRVFNSKEMSGLGKSIRILFQSAINRVFNSKNHHNSGTDGTDKMVSIRYQSRLQFKVFWGGLG